MSTKKRSQIHTFDIDSHLNKIVPRPRFYLLPRSISYWFGYRAPPKDESQTKPVTPPSVLVVWAFIFVGTFIGIAILENVFKRLPLVHGQHVPIFASFGAAAILEYNAIESPLSQPRNLYLGHFLSATIGVGLTKLFLMLPPDRFDDLQWLAGALAVAASSVVMSITKTIHPPAGATALLAVTNAQVMNLGWLFLPLVLLSCSLMLVSGMLVNNLYKRFPLYWWTAVDLSKREPTKTVKANDLEKAVSASQTSTKSTSDAGLTANAHHMSVATGTSDSESTRVAEPYAIIEMEKEERQTMDSSILIDSRSLLIPEWMILNEQEQEMLEHLQSRLRRLS